MIPRKAEWMFHIISAVFCIAKAVLDAEAALRAALWGAIPPVHPTGEGQTGPSPLSCSSSGTSRGAAPLLRQRGHCRLRQRRHARAEQFPCLALLLLERGRLEEQKGHIGFVKFTGKRMVKFQINHSPSAELS